MNVLIDQIGVKHKFKTNLSRIISLVPSQTELLCDLGLAENLLGITKFCVHPGYLAHSKVIIGGTKLVDYDKVRALKPDIIIANKEENTQEIVEELSKTCTIWVTNVVTLNDNFQMITDFGALFNRQAEAQKIIHNIIIAQTDFEQFIYKKPIQNVAYFIWAKPYMVAANHTFINELLHINKLHNTYEHLARYPEIEIEKLNENNPDYVFLSSEPFPFKDKHKTEIEKFTNAKIIFVDGEYFSWHGSRILQAFAYFKKLQHGLTSSI